jgi:hypothetical protein
MITGLEERVAKANADLKEVNEKLNKNKSDLYALNLRK